MSRFVSVTDELFQRMKAYAQRHSVSLTSIVERACLGENSPRKKPGPKPGRPRRCSSCKKLGHYARTCAKRRREERTA